MSREAKLRYQLIRQRMLWTGKTFAEVARRAGVSAGMVTRVAKGERTSRRVRLVIARVLGVPQREIWG